MKEFDDIFNKRMNEEQPFAGQKSSWTLLNKQLHLFEAGAGTVGKSLAVWKAVGVVAVLSAVGLLFNLRQITRENQKLRETIDSLQVAKAAEDVVKTNTQYLPAPTTMTHDQTGKSTDKGLLPDPETQHSRSRHETSAVNKQFVTVPHAPKPGETAEAALPHPVDATIQNAPAATTKKSNSAFMPEFFPAAQAPDILHMDSISSLFNAGVQRAQAMAIVVDSQQLISTVQPIQPTLNRPTRWRAGIRLSTGATQPREKGVSLVLGQGAQVSYNFWKGLTATIAADFFKYAVNADSIPRCFPAINVPKPDPGPHDDKLVNVMSNQVIQYYSLGLSYPVKLAGPLFGSLSLGHSWSYSPSRMASFKFEDNHGPGGPGPNPGPHPNGEYVVLNTPKSHVPNIWRFGVGLQYELPRWSFGLKGEFLKGSRKNGVSRDASIATAELLYKF